MANYLMVGHLIGGVYIIPMIRRNFLEAHRSVGRGYIISAFMASICAFLFVFFYGTSRKDIHEDASKIFLAFAVLVSALQSIRYITWKRDIVMHKVWSWRLFVIVFAGGVRMMSLPIYLLFVRKPNSVILLFLLESTHYSVWIPGLISMELIRHKNWSPSQHTKWIGSLSLFLLLAASSMLIWIPACLGLETLQGVILSFANKS